MDALADIRQLQVGERRGLQAIDKMINPPMTGPTALKNAKASILPGDITYLDAREGQQGFRPAHEVRFPLEALEAKQEQVRLRIRRAFYEDLFLMITNSDRRQITAREIEERHEEKLLALGPVLERLNQDLFDPLVDHTFYFMEKQGLIEEPPPELQGREIKVEYISVLQQAQKVWGLSGTERFFMFIQQAQPVYPEIVDKVDFDRLAEHVGEMTGIPTDVLHPTEEVMATREQRASQMQAQAQAEQAVAASTAAKNLATAPTEGSNMLTDLMSRAQAGEIQ
jgi:hypothetical protein